MNYKKFLTVESFITALTALGLSNLLNGRYQDALIDLGLLALVVIYGLVQIVKTEADRVKQ